MSLPFGIAVSSYIILMQKTGVHLLLKIVCFYVLFLLPSLLLLHLLLLLLVLLDQL